jgi:hypothetical protein
LNSPEKTPYVKEYQFEGLKITVKAGDFSEIMAKVVSALTSSAPHVANDNQKNMIQEYI